MTTMTTTAPVRGPEYDHTRPETRQPWIEFRQGGLTATEMRDWRAKKRQIISDKISGDSGADLSHVPAIRHGNLREPQIAAWVEERFGITANNAAYANGDNPRLIATPDGITLDPFTGQLTVGTSDARLSEIKTSKHDLTPGPVNEERVLLMVEPRSHFDRSGYYDQMQGQMLVMNASMTLFVYEQHDGIIDPETGTFSPVGPPEYVWIRRDEAFIERLIEETITPALAEIDAARIAYTLGELPPVSELPSEHAVLVAELLAARDAEAVAKAQKEKAWKALQAHYLAEGAPDVAIDAGFARITVSTSAPSTRMQLDREAMVKKAPVLVQKYEALVKRYTKPVPTTASRSLTITRPKNV